MILGKDGKSAVISGCGLYRYQLTRDWDAGPMCAFVMLNPSTADAETDDPTIRRCIGFAKREGCGSLTVVNLFAYRATDPADMKSAADPIGERNDFFINGAVTRADIAIAAWGAHGSHLGRAAVIKARLRGRLLCLGKTRDGQPRHPLYVRADEPLVPL